MRESEWRVVWDPLGASPRVMLGFGSLMENEHARTLDQQVAVARFDFAASGAPVSRGNSKCRLEFSRRDEHANASLSWDACHRELLAAPWGFKGTLQVQGRGLSPVLYTAALLSSSHAPDTGFDFPESVHHWAFRVAARTAGLGAGISVLGGVVNKTILLVVTAGAGIQPGDVILVEGVLNVPDGFYNVATSDGGSIGIVGGPGLNPGDPAGVEDADATTSMADRQNKRDTSPVAGGFLFPEHRAFLQRRVEFRSAQSYQAWNGLAWYTLPGDNVARVLAGSNDLCPGAWSGLSQSNSPRPINYPNQVSECRVRRIGQSDYDRIFYSLGGSGSVAFNSGNDSYEPYFELPSAKASYSAAGLFTAPANNLKQGGTIRKASLAAA